MVNMNAKKLNFLFNFCLPAIQLNIKGISVLWCGFKKIKWFCEVGAADANVASCVQRLWFCSISSVILDGRVLRLPLHICSNRFLVAAHMITIPVVTMFSWRQVGVRKLRNSILDQRASAADVVAGIELRNDETSYFQIYSIPSSSELRSSMPG